MILLALPNYAQQFTWENQEYKAINSIAKVVEMDGVKVLEVTRDLVKSPFDINNIENSVDGPTFVKLANTDIENGTIELARRDTKTKQSMPFDGIAEVVAKTLEDIQSSIYQKALNFRTENTHQVNSWDEFLTQIEKGGFISAHWDGTSETEEKIKELTKATIRCIPLDAVEEAGKCVFSGNPSTKRVIFARAY